MSQMKISRESSPGEFLGEIINELQNEATFWDDASHFKLPISLRNKPVCEALKVAFFWTSRLIMAAVPTSSRKDNVFQGNQDPPLL